MIENHSEFSCCANSCNKLVSIQSWQTMKLPTILWWKRHLRPLLKEQRGSPSHFFCFPGSLLLFTQYKIIWLTAISSNYLAALLAKMPAFSSLRRQNTYCRNLKRTFEELLLTCYYYTIKSNSRAILSQVSQSASAGKWADMTEP